MISDYDLGAIVASLGAMILYHSYLYGSVYLFVNDRIQLSTNMKNSILWLQKHRTKGDAPTATLAIQTLRNTILVAIFIGGYSLQVGIAATNSITSDLTEVETIRIIIISIFTFISFLAWASVIRIASHLGYMIGTLEHDALLKAAKNEAASNVEEIKLVEEEVVVHAGDGEVSTRSRDSKVKRVTVSKAVEMEPPDISKETSRMMQMMLIHLK